MNKNTDSSRKPDGAHSLQHDKVISPISKDIKPEEAKSTQATNVSRLTPDLQYTNEQVKLSKNEFDKASALGQVIGYIFGLLGIVILGIILGSTLNEALISHSNQYFGALGDYFSAQYALPVVLAVFGVIAFATKNYTYLLYPIIAFFIGQPLVDSDIVNYISGNIPVAIPDKNPEYFNYLVTTPLVYGALYAIEKPLRNITKKYRSSTLDYTSLVTNIGILITVITIGISFAAISETLYTSQLRERTAIRVPNDKVFLGESKSSYVVTSSASEIRKTKQRSHMGDVRITPVKEWWNRDIHTVCGDVISHSFLPGQEIAQTYKTTSGGFRYAEAVFQTNASNPPAKTNEYRIINSCFVIGYQRYDLERSVLNGKDAMANYKTEDIIDAIFSGSELVASCSLREGVDLRQCNEKDKKTIDELKRAKAEANSIALPRRATANDTIINMSAYKKVGELKIPEWGIKLPLSEETKDLYYSPTTKNSQVINGSLRSIADLQCSSGGGNAVVKGVDTIIFARTLKLEEDTRNRKDSSVSFNAPNKQVGGYLYSVYASGKAKSCMGEEQARIVDDALKWATVHIEPL